jgi:CTP:molybdopterin cytidylyltransferase MocA
VSRVSGVILAAGRGRRVGGDKSEVLVDGVSMGDRCLDVLRRAGVSTLVLVLGPDGREPDPDDDLRVVRNLDPSPGPTSSLQVALRVLGGADRIVMLPVDFPLVQPDDVRRLVRSLDDRGGALRFAVPVHDGRRGHPLVIAGEAVPDLLSLPADTPLRDVVWADPDRVVSVAATDAGVILNLNTPDDVTRAEAWLRDQRG